jgi:hypothetical protein
VFTTSRHWSLSWARWIRSTPSHPIALRPILILSSYLRLCLWRSLPPSFSDNIFYAFLTSPMRE